MRPFFEHLNLSTLGKGGTVVVKSLIAGIMGVVVTLGVVQVVSANVVDDAIAKRIKPVGSVCVEGQPCAKAAASSTDTAATGSSGASGEATFNKVCSTCHKTGVAGAPRFGSYKDWEPRIAQGMDKLYDAAIHGLAPGMPAKGTCFTCTDAQLKAAVDYMVDAAKKNK